MSRLQIQNELAQQFLKNECYKAIIDRLNSELLQARKKVNDISQIESELAEEKIKRQEAEVKNNKLESELLEMSDINFQLGIDSQSLEHKVGQLREEVSRLSGNFKATFYGDMEYKQDDPIFGSYEVTESVSGDQDDDLEFLIAKLEKSIAKIENKNQEKRNFFDLSYEAIDFHCHTVEICDAQGRIVVCGYVGESHINWIEPVYENERIAEIKAQQESLENEASLEARWDNYESAKRLRKQSENIGLCIYDPRYKNHTALKNFFLKNDLKFEKSAI